jgi:hypothetical protein
VPGHAAHRRADIEDVHGARSELMSGDANLSSFKRSEKAGAGHNRVTPTGMNADNPSGSSTRAACSDWRSPRRFHVGTGHFEPTTDAGYTTASDLPGKTRLSVSLDFGGSPYMNC